MVKDSHFAKDLVVAKANIDLKSLKFSLDDTSPCHLLQFTGHQLPYDRIQEVRDRMFEVAPNLVQYGATEDANYFQQAQELSKVKSALLTLSQTCLQYKSVENTVGKGEIACKEQFLLFPTVFSTRLENFLSF